MMERNHMIYCAQCGRAYGVMIPVYCVCGEPLSELEPIIWPATWQPSYVEAATQTYLPVIAEADHTLFAPTTPWYTQSAEAREMPPPIWPVDLAPLRPAVKIPAISLAKLQKFNYRYALLATLVFVLLTLGASSTHRTPVRVAPLQVAQPDSVVLPATKPIPATPQTPATSVTTPKHKGATPGPTSGWITLPPVLIAPGPGEVEHHHKGHK